MDLFWGLPVAFETASVVPALHTQKLHVLVSVASGSRACMNSTVHARGTRVYGRYMRTHACTFGNCARGAYARDTSEGMPRNTNNTNTNNKLRVG